MLVKTVQSRSFTVSRLLLCTECQAGNEFSRSYCTQHLGHSRQLRWSFDRGLGCCIQTLVWPVPDGSPPPLLSLSLSLLEKIIIKNSLLNLLSSHAIRSPRTVTSKNRNESTNKTPPITKLYLIDDAGIAFKQKRAACVEKENCHAQHKAYLNGV